MKFSNYIAIIALTGSLTSCGSDFLNVDPTDVATEDQIKDLAKDDPITALQPVLNGVYYDLNFLHAADEEEITIISHMDVGLAGIMMLSDLMSNDISLYHPGDSWGYDHVLDFYQEEYIRSFQVWNLFYTVIKGANVIIPQVPEDANEDGKAIKGQAFALRGMAYAYLAQFYQKTYVGHEDMGGIPLLLSKNEESVLGRGTLRKVYEQIENDLLQAIDLLDGWKRSNKTQIDKAVTQGLLSRVYLVMNRWKDAADMAHEARQGYSLMTADEAGKDKYNDIDNKEWMWGVDITTQTTQAYASFFSWMCTTDAGYGGRGQQFRLIDAALYAQMGEKDVRRKLFLAPDVEDDAYERPGYTNDKFKQVDGWLGDYVYMRASEMYLTEAEALARDGNEGGAALVLKNFMANRDPSWNKSNVSGDEVYTQRRLELWGEGFGYFDCLRLKRDLVRDYEGTNESPGMQKNIPASSYVWTYQLPRKEIQNNEHITADDQNKLE